MTKSPTDWIAQRWASLLPSFILVILRVFALFLLAFVQLMLMIPQPLPHLGLGGVK
ncbi:hypothetical protein CI102_15353 [Trichoderma harzianum]|nr:hypothetical protein CI102_15353 [Trichoderma harzianum]